MSDRSSSSRGSSPRRFRSQSPVSDAESVSPGSWQGAPATFHPSSFQSSQPALLRQPVGFGASSAPAPSYHSTPSVPSRHSYAHDVSAEARSASIKRLSKGKEKERSRDKAGDVSRKERDKADSPIQRTAFRVRSYANDPSAGGSPYIIQQGPYGAAYRAEVAERVDNAKSHSTAQPRPTQSAGDPQPKSSYYRHDYEKTRESAPANRAKQAAKAATAVPPAPSMYHHDAPLTHHQSYSYDAPTPTSNSDGRHRSSRSSKRKDTPTYSNNPYSAPTHHYGDTYDSPPAEYYHPSPAQPPPRPAPAPSTYAPSPPPSRERSHKSRSRSHHHEHLQYSSPAPAQPPPVPAPQPNVPPPPLRVCRVLTLLIEDKRGGDDDNMLTEVRVPLKEIGGEDGGFWADAKEVTEELQKGPSRIDGRAKVYTLRGKYKQYFLRISHDGEETCQSANLKVVRDRTLELFIEDNPPPANLMFVSAGSPPRVDRELLTPVTDTRNSASPAPMPPPTQKRTSRSSLFSVDDLASPSTEEQKFDKSSFDVYSRKRPRSSSLQSIQSVNSESYLRTQSHSAFSPFTPRAPSAKPSTTTSRTPSHASPPPQLPDHDDNQMSPVSPSFELPPSEPTQQVPQPMQVTVTSSFPQFQQAKRMASLNFTPNPSPPKKTKLSAPEPQRHSEHSVSPGPSQPGTYRWSHSRTPSVSQETSNSSLGFLSFANTTTAKPSLSASVSTASPFSHYETGAFSLPTPQSEPSTTPASQTNIALPSVSASIVVPTVPSLSNVSTSPTPRENITVAPTAMSVVPTLSGQAASELDNTVGKYIRGIISKEPAWDTFVQKRSRNLKMREQLEQYRYVQGIVERFVDSATPAGLEGAGAVCITKTQVMRAFNLPLTWGEECTETLVLTGLYGPGGAKGEEPRVVKMLDEANPISTGMQARKYLALLREVHKQWAISNPG